MYFQSTTAELLGWCMCMTQWGRSGCMAQWGRSGCMTQWGRSGYMTQWGRSGCMTQWGRSGYMTQWGRSGYCHAFVHLVLHTVHNVICSMVCSRSLPFLFMGAFLRIYTFDCRCPNFRGAHFSRIDLLQSMQQLFCGLQLQPGLLTLLKRWIVEGRCEHLKWVV